MKIKLTEKQYDRVIVNEDANKFYSKRNINGDNLKVLWERIEEKQKELNDMVFSEIDELTKKKAETLDLTLGNALRKTNRDDNLMQVPKVITTAGNSKLPQSTLIINITSAIACPSFYLGTCCIKNATCYAQQDENRLWHNVANKNARTDLMNTELLRKYQKGNKAPMKKYFSLIEMYINIGNAAAKNLYNEYIRIYNDAGTSPTEQDLKVFKRLSDAFKIKEIRLNESGDFPCQLSINLWSKFARKVGRKYGIGVHAYTARYLDFSNTPENFSIMPSHEDINIGNEPYRTYTVVTDKHYDSLTGGTKLDDNKQPILGETEDGTKYYKCPCSKEESRCSLCNVCMHKNKTGVPYTIFVRKHGKKNASGLRMLFTSDEMKGVIDMHNKLGWTSEPEKKLSAERQGLDKTKKLDSKIIARRQGKLQQKKKD